MPRNNPPRQRDPLFLRYGLLVFLCCLCGFVLYFAARWWMIWHLNVSKNPAVTIPWNRHLGTHPMQYETIFEDGSEYPPREFRTLQEILALSDDRRTSLTVIRRLPGSGPEVIKHGRTVKPSVESLPEP